MSFFKVQGKYKWKLLLIRVRIHPGYLIPSKELSISNLSTENNTTFDYAINIKLCSRANFSVTLLSSKADT